MIKNSLIILLIIIIGSVYYCYSYTETFTGSTSRLKQIEGNRGKDIKKTIEIHHGSATEIGTDEENNKVFQFKGKMFKLNKDNVLELNEPKKINYKKVYGQLPIIITADQIKSKIPLDFNGYNFAGMVSNSYYKQYYLLYEKEYAEDPEMKHFTEKLYSYILTKYKKGKLEIVHNIPPRSKVLPGDSIYFSYGNFQLGPLIFV